MPQCGANGVVALLHESRDPVRTEQVLQILSGVSARLLAALRDARRAAAAGVAWASHRVRRVLEDTRPLIEPLADDTGPQLPGAGSRAFWVGLIVVSLSLVLALATYLILTGLTPIVPSNEVVLGVLFANLLL